MLSKEKGTQPKARDEGQGELRWKGRDKDGTGSKG